jgi:hypothetical protein
VNLRDRRLAPLYALVLSFILAWGVGVLLPDPASTTIQFVGREGRPAPELAGRHGEVHPTDCAGPGTTRPENQPSLSDRRCWFGKVGDQNVTIRLDGPEPGP